MKKNKLIELKKRMLALSLAGIMIGTTGCAKKDENGIPSHSEIPLMYSNVEDYYKYVIKNGEAVKLYCSKNVYIFFNKETYEPSEYIYQSYYGSKIEQEFFSGEMYDLESEEMIAFCEKGALFPYNKEYHSYLINNNYIINLANASDYIENYITKDYYSLDEIKELEPLFAESLKLINEAKQKTKIKK